MTIQNNDYVIIRRNDVWMLAQVTTNRPVMFCKQKLHLGNAVGHNYGTMFEVKSGKLFPVIDNNTKSSCSEEASDVTVIDNRYLNDDGKSQKLTKDDIEVMKEEGLSGEEIVKNLVENSTTFKSKTQYAQEKYLKKKKEKYKRLILLLQPNTRLLSEMYFMQGPRKICNLRVDSLAQMLTMTNVIASGKYIVIDSCQGLLVASVLERLGPDGCVVQIHPGPGPVSSYRQAVNALNYKPEHLESLLCSLPIGKAIEICRGNVSVPSSAESHCDAMQENVELCESEEEHQKKENSTKFQLKAQRKARRIIEEAKAREMLSLKNMDGCLIATKHRSAAVILDLLEFLAPSRPFSIFSPFLPPLVECYAKLKCSGSAIFLRLTETWMRKYQVLPDRTHPYMTMSGSSGYLLNGIKVVRREQCLTSNQTEPAALPP